MTTLNLTEISGDVLDIFRELILGSDARALLLKSSGPSDGQYDLLGEVLSQWFFFSDPSGSYSRFLAVESPIVTRVIMDKAIALGYYSSSESLDVNQFLIYSIDIKKPQLGAGLRFWDLQCTRVGDPIIITP